MLLPTWGEREIAELHLWESTGGIAGIGEFYGANKGPTQEKESISTQNKGSSSH